jgi:beta-lactamase regulating signal transducer with metallopeptidase domain
MLFGLDSSDLLTLLAMLLAHGTALMLLTWLASATVLRRCRPSIQAALWTVVLVKFLLPPVLPMNFGLSGMLDSILPRAERALKNSPPKVSLTSHTDRSMNVGQQGDNESQSRSASWSNYPGRLSDLLLIAYAGLLMLFVAKALFYSARTGRRIRRLPPADEILSGEVAGLARRLGIWRLPQVRVDSGAVSPFVIGAWSPTLVMPATLPARIEAKAREALIIHELAHIRRGDVLVRWLQNVACLVFFFWPPVWWLCRRLERYSEMACDQWAIKFSPVCPQLYAESLLEVAKGVRERALISHEVGFATRQTRLMSARFKLLLEDVHDKSPRLSWQVVAVLAGWSLFALTGSVFAENGREAPGTSNVAEARIVLQQPQQSAQPGQVSSYLTASPAQSSEVQESLRERKRIEERQALMRSPASADQRSEREKLEAERLALEGRKPAQDEPALDLNGDGKISDFEAGYSAGMAYQKRKGESRASSRGIEEFKVRRDIRGVVPDWRKFEAELQLQRRKSPAGGLPLTNH